jgi:hypothetical protein
MIRSVCEARRDENNRNTIRTRGWRTREQADTAVGTSRVEAGVYLGQTDRTKVTIPPYQGLQCTVRGGATQPIRVKCM